MKIGVGITTYQRFDRFKECFENLLRNSRDVDEILIIDDASVIDREKYDAYFSNILVNNVKVIINESNSGVGISKNKIMKYFYDKGYDYFFTLEDDINVINPDAFHKYIEGSQRTGFEYLNFALHGDHNPTCGYKTKGDYTYKVYPNIVGAFTLYTPRLIEEVGYHDEKFLNAMEHVEYTYRASLLGLTSPFWQFADIMENSSMLQEQNFSIIDSSIRPRPDWHKNIDDALKYFEEKHKVKIFEIPRLP